MYDQYCNLLISIVIGSSSTVVSKGYFRSALAHEELKEYLREESEDMEYLMEAGRYAFLKSKQVDITQLMSASASGDRKQVQLMLGMGADVNMRDSVSYTSTHWKSTLISTADIQRL